MEAQKVRKPASNNDACQTHGNFASTTSHVKQNDADVARPSPGPHKENETQQYRIVAFASGDSANPKNWSKGYKWYITMVVAVTCFVVAFASSVITADVSGVQRDPRVSEELAFVTISLFVVGLGIGPMVFAPYQKS